MTAVHLAANAAAANERRTQAVLEAWALATDGACGGETAGSSRTLRAWEVLKCVGDAVDAEQFLELVAGDVAAHGEPTSWTDFAEHFNRMCDQRRTLFAKLYTLKGKLGEGAFCMPAHHAGPLLRDLRARTRRRLCHRGARRSQGWHVTVRSQVRLQGASRTPRLSSVSGPSADAYPSFCRTGSSQTTRRRGI